MSAPTETLDDYKRRLDAHDWLFYMSDDLSVFERGMAVQKQLHKDAWDHGVEGFKAYSEKLSTMNEKARKAKP